ncbi:MAG: hypothetical protein KA479_05320 [Saprospiraceae bacterium]|nr:hypothetical protein [Saprospiraceae bacterium]
MRIFFFFILSFLGLILGTSFFSSDAGSPNHDVLSAVENEFHTDLKSWERSVELYLTTVRKWSAGTATIEQTRSEHARTRLAFKKVELLAEYFDPHAVKRYINGAPLPGVDRKIPGIVILEPEGLQMLDELLFDELPKDHKEEILQLAESLYKNVQDLVRYQSGIDIQHRHVMEASRLAVIRIFTLGLTGFDTPGSGAAIIEAQQSTQVLFKTMFHYEQMLKEKAPDLLTRLIALEQQNDRKLKGEISFNDFDRLDYLTAVINPLLALITETQTRLNIEFIEETVYVPGPLNQRATNLFSPDILDKTYYNKMTNQGNTAAMEKLGKVLFYDPLLSTSNSMSCASCHHPDKAFTDGRAKSLALSGKKETLRNAPTLVHSVYATHYFLDMRENFLNRQMKHVVLDENEFATDFFIIESKLNQSEEYTKMFQNAFGKATQQLISEETISLALSAYVSSLTGWNSAFDKYVRHEEKIIDPAVKRGFNLFMGKAACGTCHFAPLFNGTVPPLYTETESEVLGVPENKDTLNPRLDQDLGRLVNSLPHDVAHFYERSFKTVSIRNIALTAPYMHNGVYTTLEEVMDFYNKGGGVGLGLDVPHQTLPDATLELTPTEISDMITFMQSLTDTTSMTSTPQRLPQFKTRPEWNSRAVGGKY